MRILIVTQKVDAADKNLGFFLRWIEALAGQAEITVLANEANPDTVKALPANVSVYSLGKEKDASRFTRFLRYERLLLRYLPRVDGVFFHMCPEYVLGAHILPRLFKKKTLLWYVHKEVSWRLRLTVLFVDRIFTASKESCRLRSKKVEVVGHGIETGLFKPGGERLSGLHLVTVGRITPVKDLRTLVVGFVELRKAHPEATFSIVGDPITESDRAYRDEMQRLSSEVRWIRGVSWQEVPRLLSEATAFVHASRTGSMDKAVLEALAAGLPVFTSSEAFSEEISGAYKFRQGDPKDFSEKISQAYRRGEVRYNKAAATWTRGHHDLGHLVGRITAFFQ